ncbi:ATP-binding protein [Paenibacillus sp. YYML68]|uniref:sensor histidine kinase n=1 Tax=Paenibacillus sp. YYML68 TaxID=2909250 RepID=UPI0024905096|nr:ATP-binding protein [Paenibacillus sp. YYML68]
MLSELYVNASIMLAHVFIIHKIYHWLRKAAGWQRWGSAYFGISYGLLGNVLMLFTFDLKDGTMLDLRALAIMLAGKQGGAQGALVCTVLVAAGRLSLQPLDDVSILSALVTLIGGGACACLLRYIRLNGILAWVWMTTLYSTITAIGMTWLIQSNTQHFSVMLQYALVLAIVGSLSFLFIEYLEKTIHALYRLRAISETDSLTGLLNYRGLHIQLRKLLTMPIRLRPAFSMYLIDVKDIRIHNLELGHRQVNYLLECTGQALKHLFPHALILARYQGDKFVLVTDEDEERVRTILDEELSEHSGLEFIYTQLLYPDYGLSEQELLMKLEEQLLARKKVKWKSEEERLTRNEKLKAVGELAAGLAHEIRNPLTAVKGFLQVGMQKGDIAPYYTIILDEINRMSELTNEFLQYSRPQSAQMSRSSLEACVSRAVQLAESSAIHHGHQVQNMSAEHDVEVMADPQKLIQVLLNLMKNGLEAMREPGTLTVRMYPLSEHFVAIEIKDTGMGISSEQMERIFSPFFTTKETGTGLGLSICQKIVQDHRGMIAVDSEEGSGSTFTVTLPVIKRHSSTA